MLWGAPLCFVLQARPVKIWSKVAFYMISNPPSIVSSLLPAPQQAILNADLEKSYAALYRPDETEVTSSLPTSKSFSAKEEDNEEPVEDDEEEESSSESEEEDDDEDVEDDEEEE